jgi:hypothetical protein
LGATEAADPTALCRARLPDLFAGAMERLRARAERGGRDVARTLDDRLAGRSACRLEIEGSGVAYLLAERGALRIETHAAGFPVVYALRAPGGVVRQGFAWIDAGEVDATRLGDLLLRMASGDAATLFRRYPCAFEARIAGVPTVGDLVLSLALGMGESPASPQFIVSVSYADLEEARARRETARDLLLSGRARIEGDTARAMMLAMTLAQLT